PLVEMREGQPRIRAGVRRVELQSTLEESARLVVGLHRPATETLETSQPTVVNLQTGERCTSCCAQTSLVDLYRHRPRNPCSNHVLYCDQIFCRCVVPVGP